MNSEWDTLSDRWNNYELSSAEMIEHAKRLFTGQELEDILHDLDIVEYGRCNNPKCYCKQQ